MDKKNIPSILQDALEHELPSTQIDLLPGVKERLVAGTTQQGEKMNQVNSRRNSRLAVIALAVMVLFVVALVSPPGRALAQTVLQFFRRAESNVIPLPTELIAPPENSQGLATAQPPSPFMSIDQAEGIAGFDAQQLPVVPDGFNFLGAMASKGTISVQYGAQGGGGALIINESPNGFMQSEWDQAPADAISQVLVSGVEAEMVQGTYVVYPGETSARWNPDAPILRLRWIKDSIWFEMARFGGVESIAYLNRDAMIALAESLTNDPFPLDVTEVRKQVSFVVLEPAFLPQGMVFLGASIDPVLQMVSLSYGYSSDDRRILINQQPVNTGEACQLCGMVGASASVESVQIGDLYGEYALGVWQLTDHGPVWQDDPDLKTLRWRKNDVAYELIYMGIEVEKEELLAVAKSMTSVPAGNSVLNSAPTLLTPVPSTGSSQVMLTSIDDAKGIAQFNIKVLPSTPQRMIFIGVTATPGSVNIRYESEEQGAGTVSISESLGDENWKQYPPEAIKKVRVNGGEAELIHGANVFLPGATTSTWNPEVNIMDLRWIENGVRFSILLTGGGVGSLSSLDENGFIKLAESMVYLP
ncbi:MAG: hypothetical protein ACM3Y8_00515 [Byssovorax cruenta]